MVMKPSHATGHNLGETEELEESRTSSWPLNTSSSPARGSWRVVDLEAAECAADGCATVLPGGAAAGLLCAEHTKAEDFLRDGEPSRYCTQCTRSHNLRDFDGKRRTCRSRIERRNKRLAGPKKATGRTGGGAPSPLASASAPSDETHSSPGCDTLSRQQKPPIYIPGGGVNKGHQQELQRTGPWPHDPQPNLCSFDPASTLQRMAVSGSLASPLQQVTSDTGRRFPSAAAQSAFPSSASVCANTHGHFQRSTNVAMKMFSMTPAHLDPNLRSHMDFLMEVVPADVRGAMRPGCLFLSVDLWYSNQQDVESARAALLRNLQDGHADGLFGQLDMDLYTQDEVYKVRGGRVVERFVRQESSTIVSADPVVCNPGATTWRVVVSKSAPDAEIRMVCRVKGRFFDAPVQDEAELPDGRFQYVLCPPMEDDALGLAWLEVIEVLPGGGETVSRPHPMFLTTRNDMCEEMTSLFQNAGPGQRREMAGVLKDLEEVLHPEDPEAPLDPSRPVALALLCARHGFHQTLEEIFDEVEYRGYGGGLALMARKAEEVYQGGILACAHQSGSLETSDVVRCRLAGASDMSTSSDASVATTEHTALTEMRQPSDTSSPKGPPSPQAPCDPWGWSAVKTLEHPAFVATTLVCSTLLFRAFPWGTLWTLANSLVIPATVHVLVPALYRHVYVRNIPSLRALALEKGVPLSHGGLCPSDADLRKSFDRYVLSKLDTKHARRVYLFWVVFGAGVTPLHGLGKRGSSGYSYGAICVLVACCVVVIALRELAVKRQSLVGLQRLNVCAALVTLANGLFSSYCAWMSGTEPSASMLILEGRPGSGFLWLATAAFYMIFIGFQVSTLPGPLRRELCVSEALRIILTALGGFFASAAIASLRPPAVPYPWVTFAMLCLLSGVSSIATRVRLELRFMHGFLSHHVCRGKCD
eukprot:jgi/Tetstr1/430497/TSEL_020305.t2